MPRKARVVTRYELAFYRLRRFRTIYNNYKRQPRTEWVRSKMATVVERIKVLRQEIAACYWERYGVRRPVVEADFNIFNPNF